MKIFVSSLKSSQKDWPTHLCDPKSIPSSTKIIEEFLQALSVIYSEFGRCLSRSQTHSLQRRFVDQ
jgi:hypothetical protein